MAGRHRCVRREDRAGRGSLASLLKRQPVRGHQRARPFQSKKRGMALVHVIHGRLEAKGDERATATDPKDNLLADPHLQVAAIELIGDAAILWEVLGDVRIQQIKLDTAHPGEPDLSDDLASGVWDADSQWPAGRIVHKRQREVVEVVLLGELLLPSRIIQCLPEVALLVQQADSHQRHAQIAGRLQVIAGQQAKPTREDVQTVGDAELRREVGDARLQGLTVSPGIPRACRPHVGVEVGGDTLQLQAEAFVGGSLFQTGLIDRAEQANRILVCALPEIRIEPREEVSAWPIPRPAQVHCDVPQSMQLRREHRDDRESSNRLHDLMFL